MFPNLVGNNTLWYAAKFHIKQVVQFISELKSIFRPRTLQQKFSVLSDALKTSCDFECLWSNSLSAICTHGFKWRPCECPIQRYLLVFRRFFRVGFKINMRAFKYTSIKVLYTSNFSQIFYDMTERMPFWYRIFETWQSSKTNLAFVLNALIWPLNLTTCAQSILRHHQSWKFCL